MRRPGSRLAAYIRRREKPVVETWLTTCGLVPVSPLVRIFTSNMFGLTRYKLLVTSYIKDIYHLLQSALVID